MGEVLEEVRLPNGMFMWAPKDILKPRNLTPPEKIALERKDEVLTQKAESRQEECWSYGCTRKATAWVREVGYDFKGEHAAPAQHVAVSSADYPGPVPGFCAGHMAGGPERLAEAVYFARPEMFWGVRPTRWFVVFTDGTRRGGMAVEIDPKQEMPKIVEEVIGGS
jgi:hypothetical protein